MIECADVADGCGARGMFRIIKSVRGDHSLARLSEGCERRWMRVITVKGLLGLRFEAKEGEMRLCLSTVSLAAHSHHSRMMAAVARDSHAVLKTVRNGCSTEPFFGDDWKVVWL